MLKNKSPNVSTCNILLVNSDHNLSGKKTFGPYYLTLGSNLVLLDYYKEQDNLLIQILKVCVVDIHVSVPKSINAVTLKPKE